MALHDAIEGASLPVIECHISNVHKREEFRHHSFISPVARGIVVGFGVHGYLLAHPGPPPALQGRLTVQLAMSVGTLILGLLLALYFNLGAAGAEFAVFGWVMAALGALGIVLWFTMPAYRNDRRPRR